MKFRASYVLMKEPDRDGKMRPRRVQVSADSVVPLDADAQALAPEERVAQVRRILLGQISGEVERE